jgi:23S rRNA pseudouridine1911/1915/1917 synthase
MATTSQVRAMVRRMSTRRIGVRYHAAVTRFAPDVPCRTVAINERGAGRRVDVFLSLRFSDWSRTAFGRWIREGLVVSDQRTLKPSTTLHHGELLRIYIPGIAPTHAAPPLPPVLFEDEEVMAVDKPAGLLMHSAGQKWAYGLIGVARDARPGADIDLAHRLDRETSGVVLVTKSVDANRSLKEAFQQRRVSKTYWALVRGVPTWDETVCDGPIGSALGSEVELKMGVRPDGSAACTRFKVLARIGAHALVGCKPLTGRTHQIRVHLDHLGFPILGDKLYGQPDDVFLENLRVGPTDRVRAAIGFPRHALHARALAFPHPRSGQVVRLKAPLPPDMRAIVEGDAPSWPA